MSRTFHHSNRQYRIKGVRRKPADMRKLARALIALAESEAEAQAADTEPEARRRRAIKKKNDADTERRAA